MEASAARGGWLRHVAAWAHHRHSSWALGGIAFADSSFLPIPPDILLVPMALLRGVVVENGVLGTTEVAVAAKDRELPPELASALPR